MKKELKETIVGAAEIIEVIKMQTVLQARMARAIVTAINHAVVQITGNNRGVRKTVRLLTLI